MRWLILLPVLVFAMGCGSKPSAAQSNTGGPLSVEKWKSLSSNTKYEPETIERLKRGDPKLETPEGWEAFQRQTWLPARKKDFPNGPKR